MTPLTSALLDAASQAPSAHNTQPWGLRFGNDCLEIQANPRRALPAADPDNRDLLHALGALVENCLLVLQHHGFRGRIEYAEGRAAHHPVIVLRWPPTPGKPDTSELYPMIPIRRTSRIAYEKTPVSPGILERMSRATTGPFRLRVLTAPDKLDAVRQIVAAADLALLEQAPLCEELHRWLRFSRRDPAWYRDGLNAECMGWSGLEAMIAARLIRPGSVRVLKKLGLARTLLGNVSQQAPFAPALCLLTAPVPHESVASRVEGGRQLQRLWLTAAAGGLCTHPLSSGVDHPPARQQTFQAFAVGPEETHVNLFRLGYSRATPRSHRLPADELLSDDVPAQS